MTKGTYTLTDILVAQQALNKTWSELCFIRQMQTTSNIHQETVWI